MSQDDIDEKFKEFAKGVSEKNKKTEEKPGVDATAIDQKNKYEESFVKKPVTGLLSVFENHLRGQIQNNQPNEDSSDEEFRTVNVSSSEVIPTQNTTEKVTEEEIESLIKVTDKTKVTTDTKKNITVDNQVYTQKKYGEIHGVVDNVASVDDIGIRPGEITQASVPSVQGRYGDTHTPVDNSANMGDTNDALQPVNKIVKNEDGEVVKSVDPAVIERIKAHKAKRDAERGNLPENYVKEDKN